MTMELVLLRGDAVQQLSRQRHELLARRPSRSLTSGAALADPDVGRRYSRDGSSHHGAILDWSGFRCSDGIPGTIPRRPPGCAE